MNARFLLALSALLSTSALAQNVYAVGEVAVIEDTSGSIHQDVDINNFMPGLMAAGGQFCRDSAKALYTQFPDQYDGVFAFTPAMLDDLMNVQQGQPVRWSDQGIGENTFDWGSQFGSASKLSQCVFMGSLPKLPASPDGPATVLLGLPLGLSGVELMGHEYGHHWMLWVMYDKNDGLGQRDLLRGYDDSGNESEGTGSGYLNGHYNYYADSHSVMYGQFITDLGNGSFKLEGGDRKYGELDQYLMGIRAPADVHPLMIADDGSGHGSAAGAIAKGSSQTVNNMTRVDVSIDDVVRAMGQRNPAYPNAQSCWRVAMMLVVPPGQTLNMADVQKVDAYRQRFEQWFTWATDGRGTMDTRLSGASGCIANPDGGVVITPDAGTEMDAGQGGGAGGGGGSVATGGGAGGGGGEVIDAGGAGGGGGMMVMPPDDTPPQPSKDETHVPIKQLRPGCGCNSVDLGGLAVLLGLLALRRRQPRS
ncbi:MAG: hypothetical protein QM723_33675 [Myxococcaceae bacterium]